MYIRGLSDDNNRTNVISKNHVITVINQIAVTAKAVFEDVVLKKENAVFSSYVLDDGKLAKLGAFSINGVSY